MTSDPPDTPRRNRRRSFPFSPADPDLMRQIGRVAVREHRSANAQIEHWCVTGIAAASLPEGEK